MKTCQIEVINENALQILMNLERANLIRISDSKFLKTEEQDVFFKKFRGKISEETAKKLHLQTNKMRNIKELKIIDSWI